MPWPASAGTPTLPLAPCVHLSWLHLSSILGTQVWPELCSSCTSPRCCHSPLGRPWTCVAVLSPATPHWTPGMDPDPNPSGAGAAISAWCCQPSGSCGCDCTLVRGHCPCLPWARDVSSVEQPRSCCSPKPLSPQPGRSHTGNAGKDLTSTSVQSHESPWSKPFSAVV